MRNFREYEIWQKSIKMAILVYRLTDLFPTSERYSLSNQIRRAAVSISSNIAEGCSRSSENDFARMLEIALGSSYELESQLIIAQELNYIKKENLDSFTNDMSILQKQISFLINKLCAKKLSP